MKLEQALPDLRAALESGRLVPYFGAGTSLGVPATDKDLVAKVTAKASVPFKIKKNLAAATQYIENFKHRKTLTKLMTEAFAEPAQICPCRLFFFSRQLPLVVDAWYDDASRQALAGRSDWGEIQGVSRAEHRDIWVKYYHPDGSEAEEAEAGDWTTVLYKPLGGVRPAANFIVSDSDYVEVLTEIDIQTPIPPVVQERRQGKSFLFIGSRFDNQLTRSYARQIIKRSGDGPHWMVLEDEPTRNEQKFVEQLGINIIEAHGGELCAALAG